jgi:hypothetical protein
LTRAPIDWGTVAGALVFAAVPLAALKFFGRAPADGRVPATGSSPPRGFA